MTDTKKKSSPGLAPAGAAADDKERVAKVMARAGLCSRRDAEAWIKGGRVAINGTLLTSPAMNVGPDDVISVDGQTIEARERTRLFLYHKPRGLVTTARDPEGRPTVFDNLPEDLPRVVSIGRLDINTEGLLLLTNDGGLARMLELPATGWLRRYRVRANGFITEDKLEALKDGITIDGVDYAGIEAKLDRQQGANTWLSMGLREGKNREIKRVLEHLGLVVNRLIRLSFGPFQLGELAEGAAEEVRTRVLKEQLGPTLAKEAGVEWEDQITAEVVTREVEQRARAERPRAPSRGERPGRGPVREEAPPPRVDRPKPSARPHVSALRGEKPVKDDGPRKRISRASTEDRKGRTVKVERITVEDKARHAGEGGTSRNARNFARDRRTALGLDDQPKAPSRRSTRGDAAVREAPTRDARPSRGERPSRDERPARGDRAARDGRSARDAPAREAPNRDARPPRGERPSRDERPARGDRFARDGQSVRDAKPNRDGKPPREGKPARTGDRREARGGFGGDRPQTGRAIKEAKGRPARRPASEGAARPPRPPGGRPTRPGAPKGGAPGRGGDRPRTRG